MNVLWVVNVPTPEACNLFGLPYTPYGGWLVESSNLLSKSIDSLSIVFPVSKTNLIDNKQGDSINYYIFPNKESSSSYTMEVVLVNCKPDIVHIYGTEMPHTLAMIKACKQLDIPFVLSIQGLVSVYSEHVYGNLPIHVRYLFTLRNILKRDNAFGIKRLMKKRGLEEIESIKNSANIVGRTLWDYSCIAEINPGARYYHCNETLRKSFYSDLKWSRDCCEAFSIFVSQGHYPIKGIHNVIGAVNILKKQFPDVKLYISGKNTQFDNAFKQCFLTTYYDRYIGKLIKKYDLSKNVIFLGQLNDEEMHKKLLSSHVYVCSSTIENSPNSLGEAMIAGVPSITSFVGGIPSLAENETEVLFYQHDAPYMLAAQIQRVFKSDELASALSISGIQRAEVTHSPVANNETILNVYNKCIMCGS
ncbi:glycosyltransferase family 4 protein [Shewanella sp. SW24]|uniref:glycosyltransferase family 4 protein n=1 Tax=Shewanella sp. SW24 TaxID=2912815 RepID=UPI0021D81F0C|nr:glycosyltransferase [Shewanella sp. SW24]MCU7987579.1 glycosyltransferase [Shewanella sp. SW24]